MSVSLSRLLCVLCSVVCVYGMKESFIVAWAGTASEQNVLLQFSAQGKVIKTTFVDDLYDNAAYDKANRLVYFSGIDGDSSFIACYEADTLGLARDAVSIPNDRALLDLQYDPVTHSLLALTSDESGDFIVVSVNVTTGEVTTLVTLPSAITSVSENSEAFDDRAGIYWIAALYETGPSGWLPMNTRTGKVGPLVNVPYWVQNTVWNEAQQSLCGIWSDGSSVACTNTSTARTTVFSPALNFSAQGFRLLGASAFDQSEQNYFSVFETHKPDVSLISANLKLLSSFASPTEKFFVGSMVFVPSRAL